MIEKLEAEEKQALKDRDVALNAIGNIVHESVVVDNDEEKNGIHCIWGPAATKRYKHHELLEMIDGYDAPRGVKVAGHRSYFLTGIGVRLNMAILNYAVDFLTKRGYKALATPFFMLPDLMAATAQLADFDEQLYKVIEKPDGEPKYLIATSEQPISSMHSGEWLEPKALPIRYAGVSSCFRKEAGSSGKDIRGIFRVHQFEKVEQFVLTSPEDSWNEHERMLKASEEFYQSLGIPYRVVIIVSGALNDAAAKKYDLEGWFPGQNNYRELVSCSNCTDYQSRALEIRYGTKKKEDPTKIYAHLLNSTLCANTRTICAILENHQTEVGVHVPEVLRPYLGNLDLIPFVKPCPVDEEVVSKKK